MQGGHKQSGVYSRITTYYVGCRGYTLCNFLLVGLIACTTNAGIVTARRSYPSAVLGVVILSVRLSVCHTHAL